MHKFEKHKRIDFERGKSLTVSTHNIFLEHPLHWHSFFEIEIILSDEGKCVVNDIEYDLSKTKVFLLTPTDFHYLKASGEVELINISFDETMIYEKDMASLMFNDILRGYSLEHEEYERLLNAAHILRHECETNGDCQKHLLQYIIKSLLRKNEVLPSSAVSDEIMKGIKSAIIFIQLHFRENITLERVASEAGYTCSYFSRLFKKATGESFIEVLTKYRIRYASTLLANGFSVVDACFSSGFGSLSNFSEAFKKNMNTSPSKYRKRYSSK